MEKEKQPHLGAQAAIAESQTSSQHTDETAVGHRNGCMERRVPRPQNAFLLFSNNRRKEVQESHPGIVGSRMAQMLGAEWKALSLESKSFFIEKAREQREEFLLDHPNYHFSRGPNKKRRQGKPRNYPNGHQHRPQAPILPRLSASTDNQVTRCTGLSSADGMILSDLSQSSPPWLSRTGSLSLTSSLSTKKPEQCEQHPVLLPAPIAKTEFVSETAASSKSTLPEPIAQRFESEKKTCLPGEHTLYPVGTSSNPYPRPLALDSPSLPMSDSSIDSSTTAAAARVRRRRRQSADTGPSDCDACDDSFDVDAVPAAVPTESCLPSPLQRLFVINQLRRSSAPTLLSVLQPTAAPAPRSPTRIESPLSLPASSSLEDLPDVPSERPSSTATPAPHLLHDIETPLPCTSLRIRSQEPLSPVDAVMSISQQFCTVLPQQHFCKPLPLSLSGPLPLSQLSQPCLPVGQPPPPVSLPKTDACPSTFGSLFGQSASTASTSGMTPAVRRLSLDGSSRSSQLYYDSSAELPPSFARSGSDAYWGYRRLSIHPDGLWYLDPLNKHP